METTAGIPIDTTLNEYLVKCRNCGKDITDCEPLPAHEKAIKLQHQINKMLEDGHDYCGGNSAGYFRLLLKMVLLLLSNRGLNNIIVLISRIYNIHNVLDMRPTVYSLDIHALPTKLRVEIFLMAMWLLEDWPDKFSRQCKRYYLSGNDILHHFTGVPNSYIDPLIDQLGRYGPSTRNRKRIIYNSDPSVDTKITEIRCNKILDYDYDADESYYSQYPWEEDILYYNQYSNKNKFDAGDIIFEQMKKAEGWH